MTAYPVTGEINVHVGRYVVRIRPHGETFDWFVSDYPTNVRQCPTQNSCRTFSEAYERGVAWAEAQADQVGRNGRLP